MNSVKKALIVIAVLLVFGAVYLVGLSSRNDPAASGITTEQPAPKDKDGLTIITFTNNGFQPETYIVPANSYVRIRNLSISILQFSSDPYKAPSYNPELNAGTFNPGDTRTFFISQQGKWGFHNGLNPSQTGTLIVTEE